MEIITIRTSQNIDIDYEIGGLGERIVGLIIDYAVFVPFVIIGFFLTVSNSNVVVGVYFVLLVIVFGFYDLLCEVFFNGQSLGKRVMKIRVISLDGSRPKFSQYLLRWLFRMVDFGLTGGLCALLSAALTEKGQRVGDIVAGTALIRTSPRTKLDNVAFKSIDDGYQPIFIQAGQLNDQEVNLIHEVINTYLTTGNGTVVYTMANRIKEHLSIVKPAYMDDLFFLQTLIRDYSYITSQADAL
jgi:uncharacterized RDD family membrane protein YckC